jgi:hypothetical protein
MFNTQPFSQRDPRWKATPLGFGNPSITIGSDGCTLNCLTMVANGFGFNETPASLNDKLKALGPGRGFSGALMVFSGLPAALPGITLQNYVLCRTQAAPLDAINATLDAGQPVIVEVDYSPSPGLQNHWVLLYDRQGDDYLMHDPWPVPAEPSASLTQRYGFASGPARIITAALFYTGKAPQPRPQPAPTPFVVVVNTDPDIALAGGLALRDAPITGAVKMRLPAGTALTVQEDAQAAAKVGQVGQWLSVVSADGARGFVAAWLVHTSPQSEAIGKDMSLTVSAPPVSDESLIGVVQPPLRRATPLVVEVNTPRLSLWRALAQWVQVVLLRRAGAQRDSAPSVPLRGAYPSGRIITLLKPGARLTVADPADLARARIGQRGEWLNVYDAQEREGFVAAESVHLVEDAPEAHTPAHDGSGDDAINAIATQASVAPALSGAGSVKDALDAAATSDSVAMACYPLVQVANVPDVTGAGGLALRDAPVNGAVKLRVPAGAQLEVREPADAGLAKVGQQGQWLRVGTSDGTQGFVAAWYVMRVSATPPTIPTTPTPPSIPPQVIAQKVLLSSADAPLLSAPQAGAASEWRVSAGTPLRVTEDGNWAAKVGQTGQFIQVQSYAFKSGYVQASLLQAPPGVDTRAPVVDAHLPKGMSAWLYGLHDPFERGLFAGSAKTGWALFTERVVSGAGNSAYADWSANGYGVIARLNNDYGGSGTIPTPDQYDAFAAQCAQWVNNSSGCSVWVIGNEMNNPREWPEEGRNPARAITPENYAACFNKVRAAIKAVQPGALVVPGAVDPFQGPQTSCLDWFTRMLAAISDLDGFALHCYSNGYTPDLVTDLSCFGNDPLRWQYYHFRAYTTFLDVIPARWRARPAFITESDPHGTSPWAGGQNGWVQAAYAEVNRWNQQPCAQQIRALILYRWSRDDIYSISDKPGVQNDLRATLAGSDYRWRQ